MEFCERFAARGFRVARFDNRDVGLSTQLKGGPRYTVDDMAAVPPEHWDRMVELITTHAKAAAAAG